MTDALDTAYEALRSWGFAPGSYACFCSECGKQHTADKRAWRCLDCAESHVTKAAERAAYLRGLEDAAEVADDMNRRMSAHLDDAVQAKRKGRTDQEWKGIGAGNASIAASRIATAIRALAKEEGE